MTALYLETAKALAVEKGVTLMKSKEQVLELHFCSSRISVDFVSGVFGYRRRQAGGLTQALARAIGVKSTVKPEVFDATAGLGQEAFLLASWGCRVNAVERSPILVSLFADGLLRARPTLGTIVDRITLCWDDSINRLQQESPEVIYLDPMFPESKNTALNKIEMRALRAIVGEDVDSEQLFTIALKSAKKRVVVKRPKRAEAFLPPDFVVSGRSVRFDVYLCR